MATTKATPAATDVTQLRRCAGSKTFGIEPHEAPMGDFPVQPSRKDGLGVMCKPHWTEYTRALRQAAKACQTTQTEGEALVDAAVTREATRTRKAPKVDPTVAAAEALVDEVDALPGPEAVKRNGDPDVQAAQETVAAANGSGRQTPLGDVIDGGTEEADAA